MREPVRWGKKRENKRDVYTMLHTITVMYADTLIILICWRWVFLRGINIQTGSHTCMALHGTLPLIHVSASDYKHIIIDRASHNSEHRK